MDRELIKLAARACQAAYKPENHIDLGHAEYMLDVIGYDSRPVVRLTIPGSNEGIDWVWNMWLLSHYGVKSCVYRAAGDIYRDVMKNLPAFLEKNNLSRNIAYEWLISGHSKGAPTAMRFYDKYGGDYCVAFCPPPAFRKWNKPALSNTTIVVDPDDIVHKLGFISFDQPILGEGSEWIRLPNDHPGLNLKDHDINEIAEYFEGEDNV